MPIRTITRQTGITVKSLRLLVFHLRMLMFLKLQAAQALFPKLGGPGKYVCIDETYFTRKKHLAEVFRAVTQWGTKPLSWA